MRTTAAIVALLLAGPVLAQEDFGALDRNGDGVLSERDRVLSAREYRLLLL